MTNLKDDCLDGTIDAVVMMGDHAYDMGDASGKRGDAHRDPRGAKADRGGAATAMRSSSCRRRYMNVFAPTLATCPWLPIVGNHEANDGDNYQRYINMSFGETLASAGVASSTVKPLHELLTKATLLGAGSTGVASNTSRYFSVDVGLVPTPARPRLIRRSRRRRGRDADRPLMNRGDAAATYVQMVRGDGVGQVHWVALELFPAAGDAQTAWLRSDLAAVDRAATPWVIVSSHYTLFHALARANLDASAAYPLRRSI